MLAHGSQSCYLVTTWTVVQIHEHVCLRSVYSNRDQELFQDMEDSDPANSVVNWGRSMYLNLQAVFQMTRAIEKANPERKSGVGLQTQDFLYEI